MSETGVVFLIVVTTIVFILILVTPGLNRWEKYFSKKTINDKDVDKNSLGINKDLENGAQAQRRTVVVRTSNRS